MPNIATAEQVYDLAGVTVDHVAIAQAQLVVSGSAGVDLSDADVVVGLRPADLRRCVNAVAWQCLYLDEHPEALSAAGNIAQASSNGSSVTYRDGADAVLAPLAARELEALTWRVQAKQVKVTTLRPYRRRDRYRGPAPDPWVTLR